MAIEKSLPRRFSRGYQGKHQLAGILFVLPSLSLFAFFHLYPIVNTISLSLYRYDLLSTKKFIGLGNFLTLLQDKLFGQIAINTAKYVLGTYLAVFCLSLGLALGLKSIRHLQGFYRTIYFIPNVISVISICIIWKLIFHPLGLGSSLTKFFIGKTFAWLNHTTTSQVALIITNVWRELGYFTVLFFAGLLAIPNEYYEAAQVDGAGALRTFFSVTVPFLRGTILLVSVLCAVRGVQTFVPQFLMTRGGPDVANTTIALFMYDNAFVYHKMGKSSAIAVLLGIIIMIFTLIQLKAFGKGRGE